jgi:hypothetical protein
MDKRKFQGGLTATEASDQSKKLDFVVDAAQTTGKTTTLKSNATDNRTLTLPDVTDTLVGKTTSDVFTNKSIDATTNTLSNIGNSSIISNAAIDASKIANGTVSNAEFQYLDGVTSAIQTQLNAKEATANKGIANGYASLDANGLVPVTQMPPAALERLVVVADQTARFALTTATVQNGDTVLQNNTTTMYFIKDDTNLNNSSGYQQYSAGTSVNFSGSLSGDVTGTQGSTSVVKVNGATVPASASVLASNASSQLIAVTTGNVTGTNISVTGGTGAILGSGVALSIPQSVATAATPTFAGLTLTGFSGVVTASAGVLSASSTLGITNGGTGQTTANAALNALLPSQASNSGKVLTTDGSNTSWTTVSATAGGSDTQVQYNNGGSLAGSANFVWDNTNSRLGIGGITSRSYSSGTITPRSQIEGTGVESSLGITRNANSSATSRLLLGKSRGTTVGSVTAVQSGDTVGLVSFQGADGTNLVEAASIMADVDGTPGTNDMPGRLVFATTADGASSTTERMRIDSSGRVGIGTTSPDSSLTIGTPTTGSATAPVGAKDIHVVNLDSTNGGMTFDSYGTSNIIAGRRAQGTSGSKTAMVNTAIALRLAGYGWDGTSAYGIGGAMDIVAEGTWSATSYPTKVSFKTVASSSTTLTERMVLDGAGNLGIGLTPQSWTSLKRALDLSNSSGVPTSLSSQGILSALTNNLTNDGTNWNYSTNNTASRLELSSGSLNFYGFASGTAGTAASTIDKNMLFSSSALDLYMNTGSAVEISLRNSATGNTSADGLAIGLDASSNMLLRNRENTAMIFYTNNTERMRLDSSGQLGINTTPSAKIHALGTDNTAIALLSGATNLLRIIPQTTAVTLESTVQNQSALAPINISGSTLFLYTASTERLRIDSSGKVAINSTTTSNAQFFVNGFTSYTPATYAGASGNGTWNTGLTAGVSASILASNSIVGGSIYSASDARLKQNITTVQNTEAINFIKTTLPVKFNWKLENYDDYGFIAQDLLAKGYSNLVTAIPDSDLHTSEDFGIESPEGQRFIVRYDSIIPILAAAMKDLISRIEALENR